MKVKQCEHRHEVTFTFTVTGFGDTEAEAIQEARDYGIADYTFSTADYEVAKVVKDRHNDLCSDCEEREE
jgi:hypothetical protein|tara:strand:+ start:318 stop:527 length:210 start_codon:yes stop_codon:yes gene_type:complete